MVADKLSTHTFLDDQESMQALIDEMPESERSEYLSYGCRELESAFPNRKMVVYTLRNGAPEDVEILNFGTIELNQEGGLRFTVSATNRADLVVRPVPVRFFERDLFLQVPQTFGLKWKGKRVSTNGAHFVPHYAALLKTRSKEIHQIESDTYCVTLNKFRERFPSNDIRY